MSVPAWDHLGMRNDDRKVTPRGFRAHLQGASLGDLVQLECLAGTRSSFQVTSNGRVGYLFFDNGTIAHAATQHLQGEDAALEILSWEDGSFHPQATTRPVGPPIEKNWNALLLHAAHRRDEESRKVVQLPRSVSPPPTMRSGPSVSDALAVAVRFDAHRGTLLTQRGDGADELAERAAYAIQLASAMGELLGCDSLVAFETASPRTTMLALLEPDGSVVALEPRPDADIASLKERFGL